MGKIYIGECDKNAILSRFLDENNVGKIYIFGDTAGIDIDSLSKRVPLEFFKYSDLIMYKYYYRLLQEVNKDALVVINECLRTSNRYDLTFNCIRRYLSNKPHRIIFNYLPIKENESDFATLYDFNRDNPFLKDKYEWITDFSDVVVGDVKTHIEVTNIEVADEYCKAYEEEKERLFESEIKNVNSIPVKMLSFSERVSKKYVKSFDSKRMFKPQMHIVVNQLKVDKYYYERLRNIERQIYECLQKIH